MSRYAPGYTGPMTTAGPVRPVNKAAPVGGPQPFLDAISPRGTFNSTVPTKGINPYTVDPIRTPTPAINPVETPTFLDKLSPRRPFNPTVPTKGINPYTVDPAWTRGTASAPTTGTPFRNLNPMMMGFGFAQAPTMSSFGQPEFAYPQVTPFPYMANQYGQAQNGAEFGDMYYSNQSAFPSAQNYFMPPQYQQPNTAFNFNQVTNPFSAFGIAGFGNSTQFPMPFYNPYMPMGMGLLG